ncbi:uncharacterized protein LOC131175293 [Hevea brasiliensis]|uniref:uncharacterized protein LOC131175293 n=1 Tax=Hevea brasiliensis TaxID=3981 RepID=UPI0025DDC1C3|nr:uncharacterized protein LOC131175293 [Hevea brasiliensis]
MEGENSFLTLAPPVFDGENYQVWAVKMEAYLDECDVWEVVEEDYKIPPLPSNPTLAQIKNRKEKKTQKSKAKACLFAAVSPTVFSRIMTLGSAKAIWDFLKEKYQGDERIRGMKVLNLVREFEMLHMKDSETIKEYSEKLLSIVNKAQEQRRLMRQEGFIEGALQAKLQSTSRGKGKKGGKGKQGNVGNSEAATTGNSSNKKEGKYPPYQYYGKKNHPHFKCWRKPNMRYRKCNKLGHAEIICKRKAAQQ